MQHKPLDLWPNNQLKSPHAIGLKKEKIDRFFYLNVQNI